MFFNRLVSKVESRQLEKKQYTRIAAAIALVQLLWQHVNCRSYGIICKRVEKNNTSPRGSAAKSELFETSEIYFQSVHYSHYFDGYNQFLLAYPYIVEDLQVISHKLHLEKQLASMGHLTKKNSICNACRYFNIWVLHCLVNSCQVTILLAWFC